MRPAELEELFRERVGSSPEVESALWLALKELSATCQRVPPDVQRSLLEFVLDWHSGCFLARRRLNLILDRAKDLLHTKKKRRKRLRSFHKQYEKMLHPDAEQLETAEPEQRLDDLRLSAGDVADSVVMLDDYLAPDGSDTEPPPELVGKPVAQNCYMRFYIAAEFEFSKSGLQEVKQSNHALAFAAGSLANEFQQTLGRPHWRLVARFVQSVFGTRYTAKNLEERVRFLGKEHPRLIEKGHLNPRVPPPTPERKASDKPAPRRGIAGIVRDLRDEKFARPPKKTTRTRPKT